MAHVPRCVTAFVSLLVGRCEIHTLSAVLGSLSGALPAQCNTWSVPLGLPGLNGVVQAMAFHDPDGSGPLPPRRVAGGSFSQAGGLAARGLAAWDLATGAWSTFGTGLSQFALVNALTTLPNGDLVVGGNFTTAGGVVVNRIARWDGIAWSALGSGLDGSVLALLVLPNGDLIAGGYFTATGNGALALSRVAHWNGTTWAPLGAGVDAGVHALTRDPNGVLVAGGEFQTAGGLPASRIAAWNGTAWSPLGSGLTHLSATPRAYCLATMADGSIVAGGDFAIAGSTLAFYVARWNGSAWSALGPGLGGGVGGPVRSLVPLPYGGFVAGGVFMSAGGVAANNVARYDGVAWSSLGPGTNGDVNALAMSANGDLVVGGSFTSAGGLPCTHVAWFDLCLPWYAVFGSGCPGSLGVPENLLLQPPQIGNALGIQFTRLPSSIAFLAVGWSNTFMGGLPLPLDLTPIGMSGCALRVSMDLLQFLPGSGQIATWSLPIPLAPSLLGLQLHTQCLAPDPGINPFGASMSDAATATIGQ